MTTDSIKVSISCIPQIKLQTLTKCFTLKRSGTNGIPTATDDVTIVFNTVCNVIAARQNRKKIINNATLPNITEQEL